MKILLVEDDSMLGDTLRRGLEQGGHAVDWLRDGAVVDSDMVLLDLGLPNRDGLTVLQQLRDSGNHVPVIILTARDEVSDRVAGLDSGADDYLSKPFALDELEARIRALARRHTGYANPVYSCGELTLDPAAREVRFRGALVILSVREYQLLAALMRRPGAILSRAQLEEQLYDWGAEIESNVLEVHIHRLRHKLAPDLIRTVRGLGYQMVSE
jgi:two-component system, OmpR family, response regulator QseB